MAVPLPQPLVKSVGVLLAKISKHLGVRWIGPDQVHITLCFIGDTEEALVPKLEQKLNQALFSFEPFDVVLGGLGAFPHLNNPKVLYIPVIKGAAGFQELEKRVTFNLGELGIKPDEKEYHPHLTLGRVKDERAVRETVKVLQEACPTQWETWTADRFILFQSRLTSKGPIYTQLNVFEFGKNRKA